MLALVGSDILVSGLVRITLASSGEKLLFSGRTKGLHKGLIVSKSPSLLHPTIFPGYHRLHSFYNSNIYAL